jgi:thioredoxin 1
MKKVIYFSATWCGPCKAYKPTLQQTTSEMGIPVQYVDIDLNPDLVQQYGIRSVPTTVVTVDGNTVVSKSGAMTKEQLKGLLA